MVMNKVLFLKMPINLSKSLTSTCSAGTLNRGPRACQCQSLCHLKHFAPLSVPCHVCQSPMGDQIAATAAAHPRWIYICTVFLPRRETFLPSWVWRVSAAQDEAGRFNPANVFSTVNRRSEFDNRYELINSAPSRSRTRLQSETMFFDQVTAAHHFKHWYLFIKTSTLLIFFFPFVKMLAWTNTKYAWPYEKHPLHYTKENMPPGNREKFKIQQHKQPLWGYKTSDPPTLLPTLPHAAAPGFKHKVHPNIQDVTDRW